MGIENPEVKKRFNPEKEPSSNNVNNEEAESEQIAESNTTDVDTALLSDDKIVNNMK